MSTRVKSRSLCLTEIFGVSFNIKLKVNPTRAEFDESNFALQNTLKKCGGAG